MKKNSKIEAKKILKIIFKKILTALFNMSKMIFTKGEWILIIA